MMLLCSLEASHLIHLMTSSQMTWKHPPLVTVNCLRAASGESCDEFDHCCLDKLNQLKSQQVLEHESYKRSAGKDNIKRCDMMQD
jgi:hypothetical protein